MPYEPSLCTAMDVNSPGAVPSIQSRMWSLMAWAALSAPVAPFYVLSSMAACGASQANDSPGWGVEATGLRNGPAPPDAAANLSV